MKTVKFKDKNENTDSRNVVDFLVSFFSLKILRSWNKIKRYSKTSQKSQTVYHDIQHTVMTKKSKALRI